MPQFYSLNSIKWFPKNIDTINGCTYNWAGLRRQVQSVYQSSRLPGKFGKKKELFDEFLCESNSKKLRTIQMTKRERVNFHFHYNCSNLIKCQRTNSLPWSKNRCASIRIIKKSSARTQSKKKQHEQVHRMLELIEMATGSLTSSSEELICHSLSAAFQSNYRNKR